MRLPGLLVTLLALGARPAGGQALEEVAEAARRAFLRQEFATILAGAASVELRIQGSEAGAAMSGAQASRTLAGLVRRAEEVEVVVASARQVGEDRAYVELTRRFRLRGVQDTEAQRILLGYRRIEGRWVITEIRVVE